MEKTKTKQGLTVAVDIITGGFFTADNHDKVYQTGRKVAQEFKKNMTIVFDEHLPKWNYTAIPILKNAEVI